MFIIISSSGRKYKSNLSEEVGTNIVSLSGADDLVQLSGGQRIIFNYRSATNGGNGLEGNYSWITRWGGGRLQAEMSPLLLSFLPVMSKLAVFHLLDGTQYFQLLH